MRSGDLYHETYTESVTIDMSQFGYATEVEQFIQHATGDEIVEVVITFDEAPEGFVEITTQDGSSAYTPAITGSTGDVLQIGGTGEVEAVTPVGLDEVALTDSVYLNQAGTMVLSPVSALRDRVFNDEWTDLVTSASSINPLGSTGPPTLSSTTGLLEFSASVDNAVIFEWQLPNGWSGEFDATKAIVVPHIYVRHLTSTTAPNNVSRWLFEYDIADANGNFSNAYGTFTTLTTVSSTNPANTARCSVVSFGDLDLAGYSASAILHCRMTRLASSDAADTDSSVIALLSIDLHYMVRRAGSTTALP